MGKVIEFSAMSEEQLLNLLHLSMGADMEITGDLKLIHI